MHIRAALIRETRVSTHLSLKNGSEISFELPFVSRRKRRREEGREMEKGGKSEGSIEIHVDTLCLCCADERGFEQADGNV